MWSTQIHTQMQQCSSGTANPLLQGQAHIYNHHDNASAGRRRRASFCSLTDTSFDGSLPCSVPPGLLNRRSVQPLQEAIPASPVSNGITWSTKESHVNSIQGTPPVNRRVLFAGKNSVSKEDLCLPVLRASAGEGARGAEHGHDFPQKADREGSMHKQLNAAKPSTKHERPPGVPQSAGLSAPLQRRSMEGTFQQRTDAVSRLL
jgi:hypothetical protein